MEPWKPPDSIFNVTNVFGREVRNDEKDTLSYILLAMISCVRFDRFWNSDGIPPLKYSKSTNWRIPSLESNPISVGNVPFTLLGNPRYSGEKTFVRIVSRNYMSFSGSRSSKLS